MNDMEFREVYIITLYSIQFYASLFFSFQTVNERISHEISLFHFENYESVLY